MSTNFDEFKALVRQSYPQTLETEEGILQIELDGVMLSLARLPYDDENSVTFRGKVAELSALRYQGEFALSALEGNLFWTGTNGATLSVGSDGSIYLTEQRFLEEFTSLQDLDSGLGEFVQIIKEWQVRSELYV